MPPEPVSYRFGPLERRGFLAGLRLGQVLVLAAGSALTLGVVGSIRGVGALVPATVVVGLTLASAFARLGSHAPDEWLPLAVRHLCRRLRRRSGFVSEAPLLGHTLRGGPPTAVPDTLRGVSLLSVVGDGLQVDGARVPPGQGRDPDVAAYMALARELEALAGQLQAADLHVEGALPPRALAQLIRLTFDPAAQAGLALRTANHGRQGVDPANAWPLAASTCWSSYRVESAWHRVYWVREWPRTPVGPDFMAPLLLQTRSVRTISMVMEPIPPLRARRAVEAARVADASDEHVRRRAGFVTSVRRQREQEQVLARERELADGHSDVRFSAYVLVTAPSLERLEEAGAEIEQQAGQARLELGRLDGGQDVAFTYCLPPGRGLRGGC